ncbi:unnamed protein product [Paramecium sonneborni]|uniref:EF-hand domain-containing protein n=1 Tax=Paramecium sonneborni TaxID=65129 RepID=A0A8S1NW78_9CILI|nr:unnamed protein product [Paramecium sonneborni]
MGNKPSVNQNKFQRQQTTNDKQFKKDQSQSNVIAPYREGTTLAVESKLKAYLKNANEGEDLDDDNQGGRNKLQQFKEDQHNVENIQKEIIHLEETVFSKEKLQRVREDFESYSKENKMSRKKLLEYFGMAELDNKRLGNRIFQCVKSTFSQKKTGPFLDYAKFLKAISMLSQQNDEGRLRFLYSMFDMNLEGSIEKDEMYNLMMMFLEGMMSINYENQDLNDLKQRISESHDRQIELALEEIVNEIYQNHASKQNVLSYDDWRNWLMEQEGISEILSFNPHTDFQD